MPISLFVSFTTVYKISSIEADRIWSKTPYSIVSGFGFLKLLYKNKKVRTARNSMKAINAGIVKAPSFVDK
jgi:hypothetical protein